MCQTILSQKIIRNTHLHLKSPTLTHTCTYMCTHIHRNIQNRFLFYVPYEFRLIKLVNRLNSSVHNFSQYNSGTQKLEISVFQLPVIYIFNKKAKENSSFRFFSTFFSWDKSDGLDRGGK